MTVLPDSDDPHFKESLQASLNEAVQHHAWDKVLIAVIRGADPHDKRTVPGGRGMSALHIALDNRRIDVAESLLRLGADPDFCSDPYSAGDRIAPLHIVASRNLENALPLFLDASAAIDVRDIHDRTPLFIAIETGNIGIAKALLANGADPNAPNKHGDTPLHRAIQQGDIDSVHLLIDAGADPTLANSDGATPTTLARLHNNRAVLASLTPHSPSSYSR